MPVIAAAAGCTGALAADPLLPHPDNVAVPRRNKSAHVAVFMKPSPEKSQWNGAASLLLALRTGPIDFGRRF